VGSGAEALPGSLGSSEDRRVVAEGSGKTNEHHRGHGGAADDEGGSLVGRSASGIRYSDRTGRACGREDEGEGRGMSRAGAIEQTAAEWLAREGSDGWSDADARVRDQWIAESVDH